VNGKFMMIYAKRCGEFWHIIDIVFTETASTENIEEAVMSRESDTIVVECGDAYFNFVRDMREKTSKDIRVMKENPNVDGRIAATSDYVKTMVRFNEEEVSDNPDYARFLSNLYDYNKDSQSKEASTILSGFIQYAVKQE